MKKEELSNALFEISDTVSDETSLVYAFLTGILPDKNYKVQLKTTKGITEIDLEVRDRKYNIKETRKVA